MVPALPADGFAAIKGWNDLKQPTEQTLGRRDGGEIGKMGGGKGRDGGGMTGW